MILRASTTALLLGLAIATLIIPKHSTGQTKSISESPKVDALLKERRDTLKKRLDTLESMLTYPKGSYIAVLDARDDFLRSELELTATKNERLALLKSRVANLNDVEEHYKALKVAGQASDPEILWAKARRLDAEIDLERNAESE